MRHSIRVSLAVHCLCVSVAFAHEFWVEPESFQYKPNELIKLRLFVGERFDGEPLGRNEKNIDRFEAIGGAGAKTPIIGRSGDPLNLTRIKEAGDHVVCYRGARIQNEMPARKFEDYLKHEGLGFIIPIRREKGESDQPGREVYSRCAKSLIHVGDESDSEGERAGDRPVGLPLEIMLETQPAAIDGKRPFVTRIVFQEKPLEGAMVVAVAKRDPSRLVKSKTDKEGRAELPIDGAGVWMITTIHMVRAPADVDSDWESFWASYTFRGTLKPQSPPVEFKERPSAASPNAKAGSK